MTENASIVVEAISTMFALTPQTIMDRLRRQLESDCHNLIHAISPAENRSYATDQENHG